MSSSFGKRIKVQIFGQSHSEMLGVVIDGLPAGYEIDMERVQAFLNRRRGGQNAWSTARAEADVPRVVSGMIEGRTCGAPLCALFENSDTRSEDYDALKDIPRPSHADLYAQEKYGGYQDARGGGHFSGRLTLPLCFAGAVCKQILEERDIYIGAHIEQIYTELDEPYNPVSVSAEDLSYDGFPVNDPAVAERMQQVITDVAASGDSVGGIIECAVVGMDMGEGSPMFDGIENRISAAVFGVPAVRGIEFGAGFDAAGMLGSEHNDSLYIKDEVNIGDDDSLLFVEDVIGHKTNHAGGIVGGLSTSMPIIFRVAIKPTPSIALEQDSVKWHKEEDWEEVEEVKLNVGGRHDPCIVPRAVPCIEAAAAIALVDLMVV